MSTNELIDAVSKCTAKAVNRRQAMRGIAAGVGGILLSAVGVRGAVAAPPRTCVICECGTGNPCNVKFQCCQETRFFSGDARSFCQTTCARRSQNLCGVGSPFHCPQGCSSTTVTTTCPTS